MAVARDLRKEKNRVVAVIGDGSLSSGLALEGLNQAGHQKRDLIVILNDNEWSISQNVGALSGYLNRMMTGKLYTSFRKRVETLLKSMPHGAFLARIAKKSEELTKGFIVPGLLFEELGYTYIGPIPGHDLEALIGTFQNLANIEGPVLVHVVTSKGKGYAPAEANPEYFHGVGTFDPETGKGIGKSVGAVLHGRLLRRDRRAREGEPEGGRHHRGDVRRDGPCEIPRDVPRPVLRRGDRGIPRGDLRRGPCPRGEDPRGGDLLDLPAARLRPDHPRRLPPEAPRGVRRRPRRARRGRRGDAPGAVRPVVPAADPRTCRSWRRATRRSWSGCCAPRWRRPSRGDPLSAGFRDGGGDPLRGPRRFPGGRGSCSRTGRTCCSSGSDRPCSTCLHAAQELRKQGVSAAVVDARFVKPLDADLLLPLVRRIGRVVTVEENLLAGGFGSAVMELLEEHDEHPQRFRRIGVRDRFVEHGTPAELREACGLTSAHIVSEEALRICHEGKSFIPSILDGIRSRLEKIV